MSALFPMTLFGRFFQNQSKSVISGASKICHIFRTKTSRALIFVANDRYKVALAISLSLKASSIFPDREFWVKNGPKSEFLGKSEKSGKSGTFVKTVIFLCSMCFKHKNTFCVQISSKNIDF